jgi:hypothetical protein
MLARYKMGLFDKENVEWEVQIWEGRIPDKHYDSRAWGGILPNKEDAMKWGRRNMHSYIRSVEDGDAWEECEGRVEEGYHMVFLKATPEYNEFGEVTP